MRTWLVVGPAARALATIGGLLLVVASSASAQSVAAAPARGPEARCPTMEGAIPALATRAPAERMAYLLRYTQSYEEAARTWTTTFAVGYFGITAGALGAMVALDGIEENPALWVSALFAAVGVVSRAVLGPKVIPDRPRMERLAPAATAGDCAALARAEALFERDAESADFGTSWLMHVGVVLLNAARVLWLGIVHGEWLNGLIGGGVGIAIGEVQILTQPTELVDALARYRAGELDVPPAAPGPEVVVGGVVPIPGGLVLSAGGAY